MDDVVAHHRAGLRAERVNGAHIAQPELPEVMKVIELDDVLAAGTLPVTPGPANRNRGIEQVMNMVVGDSVLSALDDEYARRRRIHQTDVVNMIVCDDMPLVHIERIPPNLRFAEADTARPGLTHEKVGAAGVQLLERTLIRVGNDEYARNNKSYGLTTLRNRHIQIAGSRLVFRFRGKSNQHHEIALTDKKLARIVKRCRDLPGQDLFQYIDEQGERRAISSGDVNGYIQGIIGDEFSAKDFRTWAGTLLAASGLAALDDFNSDTEAKSNTVQIIKEVAATLGNTPAICRRCYVHPTILDAYLERSLNRDSLKSVDAAECSRGLRRDERWLLAFLRRKTKK